jgi:long-chain acyl-CoA synthetase
MFSLSPDWRYKTATAAWEEFFFSNYRSVAGWIWKRFTYEYGTLFLNLFPISQTAGFRSSLAYMGRIADRGLNILVFPEGARSCDGRLMPFRQGVGIMVSELGVPLVPIRISGMERVLPPGSAWPRRGRVRVAVGAPLFLSTEKPSDIVTAAQRALQDLEP